MSEWTMIVHIYMHLHIPDLKPEIFKEDGLALHCCIKRMVLLCFRLIMSSFILDSQIPLQGINCYFHYSNLPFLINYKWKAIVRT